MRILFIGDVMGRSGRDALKKHLPMLQDKLSPDVIIVNGENAAHGKGITGDICKEFYSLGVDCITTGNHIWDQREIIPYIGGDKKLLRPINFPEGTPGLGVSKIESKSGELITVMNAMGRLFMESLDDPFRVVADELKKHALKDGPIFVDFHAETTSEKMSFGHHFDGKITAMVGTHTHVPTADAHILPGGTGFQTDAGMTGDYDSVIGVRKDIGIHRFVKKMPGEKIIPASEEGMLCGTLIVANGRNLTKAIAPVRVGKGLGETIPEI
jgi:metallophosphoesterase (TIGR00282 family)